MRTADAYLRTTEALLRLRGVMQDDTAFRAAAVPLAGLGVDEPARVLQPLAAELAAHHLFSGSCALAAAAVLLARGRDAAFVAEAATAARQELVDAGADAWGYSGAVAALTLALDRDARPQTGAVARAMEIMALWKADHSFLTGADDLPFASIHALAGTPPRDVALHTETAWRHLRTLGYWPMNDLQRATHLLSLADPATTLQRFEKLLGALRDRALDLPRFHPEPPALLALSPRSAADLARDYAATCAALRGAKPAPGALEALFFSSLLTVRGLEEPGRTAADVLTVLWARGTSGPSN